MSDTPSSYRSLKLEHRGDIAEVTLIGPGKGNAMGPDLFRELPLAFRAISAEENVRVVVLRGAGENFSYGLDLPAMSAPLAPHLQNRNEAFERGALLRLVDELQAAITAVQDCRKPVIAAVQGWCIGGAVELIAACDIRICSDDAKFSLREVKLGIVADLGGLQRLPRIIGAAHTRHMAMTGADFDAQRALAMSLVTEIAGSQQELAARADALASEIAANPPLVVQGIKRVMNDTADMSLQEALNYNALWSAAFLQSADIREAMQAFLERRAPKFTGR
jgi:enoyl-CoA hydratase